MLICNAMLTGNWAQRSFFITAIARVTAGLRWPVECCVKFFSQQETVPGPTSRYTTRHADPDHQGKPIAKSHMDKVPSLDIEVGGE